MAKFRFRLATLQKLREAHRDEMRTKLAEAYQAEAMLQEQLVNLHAEETKLQQDQREHLQQNSMDMNQMLDTQRYNTVLRGQIATLNEQSKLLITEIEKRRQALVDADRQVRILEKLHDRQLDAHRREALLAEVKMFDEVASRPREVEHSWAP